MLEYPIIIRIIISLLCLFLFWLGGVYLADMLFGFLDFDYEKLKWSAIMACFFGFFIRPWKQFGKKRD